MNYIFKKLIIKYLGDYINEFNKDDINLHIFKGKVCL